MAIFNLQILLLELEQLNTKYISSIFSFVRHTLLMINIFLNKWYKFFQAQSDIVVYKPIIIKILPEEMIYKVFCIL